jgi:hypothetical protein
MMYCNALPAHAVPHHDTVGRNPQLPVIRRLNPRCRTASFIAGKAKFKVQAAAAAVPGGLGRRTFYTSVPWKCLRENQNSGAQPAGPCGFGGNHQSGCTAKHRAAIERPPRG